MSAINITYYNTANSIDLEVIGTITMTFNHDIGNGGGIEEAPIDGKQYARKDADWEEVAASGDVNVIESISINETALTPDVNKNVNIALKTINGESIEGEGDIPISGSSVVPPEFTFSATKETATYEGIWLKIPHSEVVNLKKILIRSAKALIGSGWIDLDLIVNYPSAETYSGLNIYSGFYVIDNLGLIKPNSNFNSLIIEYDIEDDVIQKYNFKRLVLGNNVISSHRKDSTGDTANEMHAMSMECAFKAAYGNFAKNYINTCYDEIANYADPLTPFEPTYFEKNDADLLIKPYTVAALSENSSSNPDFLEVGSHYGNTYSRNNITEKADTLLSNAIAVGARPVNDWATTIGCTSYGYGMEFFEITEWTYLLNKYPQRGLSVQPFIALQLWSNADRTQVWTEYAGHIPFMEWYEIGDKVFVNIDIASPTFGGTHSPVWTFRYNPESVICAITDIIIDGGVKKFVLDIPIWETQLTGNKYMWAFLPMTYTCGTTNGSTQSPATMIVGAKMQYIKDFTGLSFKEVRLACRETAVLTNDLTSLTSALNGNVTNIPVISTLAFPNEGIIKIGNYKFVYTSKTSTEFIGLSQNVVADNDTDVLLNWDIYRGFGQIDEAAAILYLQTKYTNNTEFVKQESAFLESVHGISPVLTFSDILENSPLPKKIIEQYFSAFQQKTLYFSNKSVLTTDFVADTTYSGYGYKAVITCTGVTSTMLSEVTFSTVEADSGNYARVCLAGTNTVTIYAKAVPLGTITIPTIKSETV